jgi:hypothetical protein
MQLAAGMQQVPGAPQERNHRWHSSQAAGRSCDAALVCLSLQALPEGGVLVALDRDPVAMAVARRYWQAAGVQDKVSRLLSCEYGSY